MVIKIRAWNLSWNKDSCGNENQKSQGKNIFHGEKIDKHTFCMKIEMMDL